MFRTGYRGIIASQNSRNAIATLRAANVCPSPLVCGASELANGLHPVVASQAIFARHFHGTGMSLGGRYTTQKPEKAKHWREHLSKKAKKRVTEWKEKTVKRSAAAAGNDRTTALALRGPNPRALAASQPEAVVARSAANRVAIESVVLQERVPERAEDALKRVDVDALHATLKSRAVGSSPGDWSDLIRAYGAQGRFSDAVTAFADQKAIARIRPDVYTFTALLHAAGQQRNKVAAVAVFDSMREAGVTPTIVTYGALIQAHVRSFDLEGARRVLAAARDDIRAGGDAEAMRSPVLHTAVINGLVQAGKYEDAWDVWMDMRIEGVQPDAVAFTCMITACGKTDQVEKGLNLLLEMKRNSIQPSHVTYNALMHAAGRSMRLYHHAYQLFSEMEVHGLARDVYSYNAVILAASQTADVTKAREFMYQMTRDRVTPNIFTINTLLTVYARALKDVRRMGLPGSSIAVGPEARAALAMLKAKGKSDVSLLALDKEGKLAKGSTSDDKQRFGSHQQARLVQGETVDMVDRLLADYFGADPDHPSMVDPEDEALTHKGEAAMVAAAPHKYLPPLKDISLDINSEEYKSFKQSMLASGLIDADLLADIEAEHSRYPGLDADSSDEELRAEAIEERHQRRLARLAQEAMDIAVKEQKQREEEDAAAAAPASSSSSSSKPSASQLLLSSRSAGRPVSLTSYLAALEKEVMTGLYGEETETIQVPVAAAAAGGGGDIVGSQDGQQQGQQAGSRSVTVRRWASLFDEDAVIGGQRVSDMMDTTTIPLPRPTKEDVATSPTGHPGDADLDPAAIERHYAKVVQQRLAAAIERENAAAAAAAAAAGAPSPVAVFAADPWSDPYLSDNAEEYQEVAMREMAGRGAGGADDNALQAVEVVEGRRGHHEASGGAGDAASPSSAGSNPGVSADVSPQASSSPPSTQALRTAASPSAGATTATATAAASSTSSLPPHLRRRQTMAARVLNRLLQKATSPSSLQQHESGSSHMEDLQRSLVTASEGVEKYRKRRGDADDNGAGGGVVGLMDVLVAVRRLKERAASDAATLPELRYSDPIDSGDGSDVDLASSPAVAAAVSARHSARQEEARRDAVTVLAKSPSARTQLEALSTLSDRLLSGAHWLPSGQYPSTKGALRSALLAEVDAIYKDELPRAGLTPDLATLNVVLTAICNAGDAKRAYAFLTSEFSSHGVHPDARTFRPLIRMHTAKGNTARAEAALDTMVGMGLRPDADCYGLVVHARARDWRVKDSIALISRMKADGITCPEVYARLVRHRCKELGIMHADVPEHPIGWQFRPEVMKKRTSTHKLDHKHAKLALRPQWVKGMR